MEKSIETWAFSPADSLSATCHVKKEKCPDCMKCQMCGESRCRLCREGLHGTVRTGLGSIFTYGQYKEWKRKSESGPCD